MGFEYGFWDQISDQLSGEGREAGGKRRAAAWKAAQPTPPMITSGGVRNMSPNGVAPTLPAGVTSQNRWAYDNARKAGYSEADAIAVATGGRPTQQPTATAAMSPAAATPAAAPVAAPDPYDRWLNDPFIQRARQRLDDRYTAEESRVNPYTTDSPAFRAMVEGQQGQARLQFAPGAMRMFDSLAGGGATSGKVAASRAAYSGGAARALADIATSAATKQYENQQAFEDRRSQAMQNIARDSANVGLGVTGQGIGVTSTQQALKEDTRRFDITNAEDRRRWDENLATRKDEFAKTYAQADQGRKDQLALAYSQLSQQAKQFADQLVFSKSTTLSAEDQYNLGIIQAVAGAVGTVGGSAVSAMKGG